MLNIKEICEIIPQRAPFLMIDKVEELEAGKHAVAYKNVCINEWYFEGHFPSNPIIFPLGIFKLIFFNIFLFP